MLRFSLGVTRMDNIIRGERRWGRNGEKHEKQDRCGLDMYRGNMMGIFGEGRSWWNCQEIANGESLKGGIWML